MLTVNEHSDHCKLRLERLPVLYEDAQPSSGIVEMPVDDDDWMVFSISPRQGLLVRLQRRSAAISFGLFNPPLNISSRVDWSTDLSFVDLSTGQMHAESAGTVRVTDVQITDRNSFTISGERLLLTGITPAASMNTVVIMSWRTGHKIWVKLLT